MKIVSTVPASRFEKYGVAWPSGTSPMWIFPTQITN